MRLKKGRQLERGRGIEIPLHQRAAGRET